MARYKIIKDSPTPFVEANPADNWNAHIQQVVDLEGEDVAGGDDVLLRFGYSKVSNNRSVERTHLTLPLSSVARYIADGIRNQVIPTKEARDLICECVKALAPVQKVIREVECLYSGCGMNITLEGEDATAPFVAIQCPRCKRDNIFGKGYPEEVPKEFEQE
jgi:hypothetical protein